MSKAMNRSFSNVLFGAFGQEQTSTAAGSKEARPVRSATPEEAAAILAAANKVVVVPGYGMAVAQAQHKVRELYDALTKRGIDVKFGIHPVAGRMPGHMNVLLAEADIPYDKLLDMDEINGEFPQTDVALVIGANDVTNPAARTDASSPIFGMPILDVDKARTVMVIKRRQSHNEQHDRHSRKRQPVARRDAVKQAAQEPRQPEASDNADGQANQSGADSLTQHNAHNIAPLRPKSHADANFPGALQHHMRNQPVQSDDSENYCQRREAADQVRRISPEKNRRRLRGNLFQRLWLYQRKLRIHLLQCGAGCSNEPGRLPRGAHKVTQES